MAVPLNLPEDHNEVENIINQLQYLLTKLQAALRRSQRGNSQFISASTHATRVRTNCSNRSRTREGSSSSSPASSSTSVTSSIPSSINISDVLLNNLAWLAASIDSNTEESKMTESTAISHDDTVQDWNQVGCILRKITPDIPQNSLPKDAESESENEEPSSSKSYSREGIFSKIVPGPVSAPIWTAMICFVGWHIFRAR